MLNAEELRKISKSADKKRKARERRNYKKFLAWQETQAKKEANKLIPKAEKKVKEAARKGLDSVKVYEYRDSYASLPNKVADLVEGHFSMNFKVSHFVEEEDNCYFATHIVVHIR